MTLFDKSKISSEENWLANDCNTNNNKTSVSNEVENQWNEIFGETNRVLRMAQEHPDFGEP